MRKRESQAYEPFGYDDLINVYYELNFNNDVIKGGDRIKFKTHRGTYAFIKWVHNARLDVQWIDCWELDKHGNIKDLKSFYIGDLKSVVRAKKSRRKKLV